MPRGGTANLSKKQRYCDYADARSKARRVDAACSSFAAGVRLKKVEIRLYATERPVMMVSACSSRIWARQIVALGAMMFPDTLKLLFGRLLFEASRREWYCEYGKVKSSGMEQHM